MVEEVRDLETAIRDRINQAKLRFRLLKDQKAWNEIVSALDVIGDTELAFSAYLSRYPSDPDFGSRYLLLYGVLQAVYTQQDAVVHLSQALGGRSKKEILGDERIRTAREVRNQAIGHPTRKEIPKSEPTTTHQISRITLGQYGFEMFTADEHGEHSMKTVNVITLIHGHREAVAEVLKALDQKLDRDDKEARRTFQHERLVDSFPDTLGYTFEKLWEATQGGDKAFLGPVSLATVRDVLQKFVEALERRGLGKDAYPGVRDWFAEVIHPIGELARFFDPASGSTLHPKTAAIVASHLQGQLDELKSMAAEIDEDWRPNE